jgi:hypothetical protein
MVGTTIEFFDFYIDATAALLALTLPSDYSAATTNSASVESQCCINERSYADDRALRA